MPYIKKDDGRREALQNGDIARNAGELNYQIFYYVKNNYYETSADVLKRTIVKFVSDFVGDTPNYQQYNDMTGALVRCAKEIERRLDIKELTNYLVDIMESYDREIARYEEKKIIENGDVDEKCRMCSPHPEMEFTVNYCSQCGRKLKARR